MIRRLSCLIYLAFAGHAWQALAAPPVSFEAQIAPILKQSCVPCHDEKTHSSGLSVITPKDLLTGGARHGAAIQPGKPDESILLKALRGQLKPQMPLGAPPLSADKIALIAAWITNLPPAQTKSANPSTWWSFLPPQKAVPPPVKNTTWARTGIDPFILGKLEENVLTPAPEAAPRILLRRAFFDLIGLPPTPAETTQFLEDKSPQAYEHLIDRLLADPRYGERWGRHWLDLARYADSRGFEGDLELSHAWRYRDYVIRAFNDDKPYDRFIKEQLAADEAAANDDSDGDPTPSASAANSKDALTALGFLRLSPWFGGGGPGVQVRQNLLDEVTATVSSVFLGVTVKCAQCHNHKYDPIPQKDYYRLQAFFAPVEFTDEKVPFPDAAMQTRMEARRIEAAAQLKAAEESFKQYETALLAKLAKPDLAELKRRLIRDDAGTISASQDATFSPQEKQRYLDLLAMIDARNPVNRQPGSLRRQLARYEPVAHTVRNAGVSPLSPNRPTTHVLLGGEWDKLGEPVEPGFPSALTGNSDPAPLPTRGFGDISRYRSILADWIASPKNPLTARVMVNRIWQFHFGAGLVSTASDFGRNGAQPTHPELLDWLALQFVENKWSIKAMHRLIMTSSVYRQSSVHFNEAAAARNPSNSLLWRMNRRRLEAESLRDSILAVSGRLNPERGGPGVFPHLPQELATIKVKNRSVWETSRGAEAFKRSIYITQRRQLEMPFLKVMDAPTSSDSCERRFVSTTALQALTLLNGDLVNDEARHFAQRVIETAGPAPAAQIRLAFALAFARPPAEDEVQQALTFLQSEGDLTAFCRILFNTNEFLYVR